MAIEYKLTITPLFQEWLDALPREDGEECADLTEYVVFNVNNIERYSPTVAKLYRILRQMVREQFPTIKRGDKVVIESLSTSFWYIDPDKIAFQNELDSDFELALPPEFILFHGNFTPLHWSEDIFGPEEIGAAVRIKPLYLQSRVGNVMKSRIYTSTNKQYEDDCRTIYPDRNWDVHFVCQEFIFNGESFFIIAPGPSDMDKEMIMEYMLYTTNVNLGYFANELHYEGLDLKPVYREFATERQMDPDDFQRHSVVCKHLALYLQTNYRPLNPPRINTFPFGE